MTAIDTTVRHPRPLRLPQITLILGPPGHGQEPLAQAISSLDNAMEFLDLMDPLREATHELFFSLGMTDTHTDLRDNPSLPIIDTEGSLRTVNDWLDQFRYDFRKAFGKTALADLSIARMEGRPVGFDRYLISGLRRSIEVNPFRHKFGDRSVLTLNLGPMSLAIPGATIHFASIDPVERMAQLRHEVGDLFE